MIIQSILSVLILVFVILQLQYYFSLSSYIHLLYLRQVVTATFTVLFLIALYFVYKTLKIRYEQSRFKCHKYMTVQTYNQTIKQNTEKQLQKLMRDPRYKQWKNQTQKQKAQVPNKKRQYRDLKQFQQEFGLITKFVE